MGVFTLCRLPIMIYFERMMTPVIIGIASGIVTILLIVILRLLDTKVIYGLILSGIGFLYVGFVWTDVKALVINSIQAFVFLLLAYWFCLSIDFTIGFYLLLLNKYTN